MSILALSVGFYRAGLVGDTRAAVVIAFSTLAAFLAAWAVAGRAVPQIMLPFIALFSFGTFIH